MRLTALMCWCIGLAPNMTMRGEEGVLPTHPGPCWGGRRRKRLPGLATWSLTITASNVKIIVVAVLGGIIVVAVYRW